MRKHYSSIAKLFLLGAVVTTGVTFTSCSDDAVEATQSNVAQSLKTTGANDGTYLTENTTGNNSYGVKFDGNEATITRNASASAVNNAVSNATVTYTDDTATQGYLTINDNSLGMDKVPFIVAGNFLQLNFADNGGLVYLDKQCAVTRDASSCINDGLATALLGSIAKCGISAVGGTVLGLVWSSFSAQFFPDAKDVMTQQKLDNILSEIQNLRDDIGKLSLQGDKQLTSQQYDTYWNNIHILHAHCQTYLNLIQEHKTKGREDLAEQDLRNWALANIGANDRTYQVASGLKGYINSCLSTQNLDGHTWYNILDKYVFYYNDWESDGYTQRTLLRAYDLFVYIESLGMLKCYYDQIQASTLANEIQPFFEKTVLPAFEAQRKFPRLKNLAICQMDDAYVVLEKTTGKKTFGDMESFGDNGTKVNNDIKYFDCNGGWAYSYVFSQDNIHAQKKELYTLCLTPKEANAMYNNSKTRGSLYQILANQGVTGLDDPNGVMLLQEGVGDDWEGNGAWGRITLATPIAHIIGNVWNNAQNKQTGMTFDNIVCDRITTGMGFIYKFRSHNTGKWAYYTNVIKHYKDFDDLLSFEKQYEKDHNIEEE